MASRDATAQQTPATPTPISLTTLGSAYSQDFNTLGNSESVHNLTALPVGWVLSESGPNADGAYRGSNGATNTGTGGDVYSYGSSGSGERAFGTLFSTALTPTIGAVFTNNTGSALTSLAIGYRGEEWRLGATGRGADRLDFQYSLDATSLSSGTWTDIDAIDFNTPNVLATVGAVDGNASGNFSNLSTTILSLSIANSATFWIRWNDFNAVSSDDGLAVDDFSLTPQGSSGSATWNGNASDGKWSSAGNWGALPSNASSLIFSGTHISPTPTNDSFLTNVSSITFDNTASAFTLNGSGTTTTIGISGGVTNNSTSTQTINLGLTLAGAQQINAASGNIVINGAVAISANTLTVTGASNTTLAGAISGSGALAKSGSGTLTVSGNNSYGGGTTVNDGTLIVGHANALGSGALAINNSAATQLQSALSAPVQLSSLTIAGGSAPTAKLDVTDNNMVVHNSSITTTLAQLKSGLNASGTLWTGTGIQSSTAAADAAANSNSTVFAVGAIKNIDKNGNLIYSTWPAPPSPDTGATGLATTDVLVKYTYFGDADLNGVVDNTTDYDLWSNGFTDPGLAATNGWLYGDFDFSGIVDNTTDYDLWSTGFAHQGGPLSGGGGAADARSNVQPVPEPSALALIVMPALGLAFWYYTTRGKLPRECMWN